MRRGADALRALPVRAAHAPGASAAGASVPAAASDAAVFDGPVKILTSCPSCLQGLSRYEGDTGVQADYIVVEMARHLLGEGWMEDYVRRANDGGIERVLV